MADLARCLECRAEHRQGLFGRNDRGDERHPAPRTGDHRNGVLGERRGDAQAPDVDHAKQLDQVDRANHHDRSGAEDHRIAEARQMAGQQQPCEERPLDHEYGQRSEQLSPRPRARRATKPHGRIVVGRLGERSGQLAVALVVVEPDLDKRRTRLVPRSDRPAQIGRAGFDGCCWLGQCGSARIASKGHDAVVSTMDAARRHLVRIVTVTTSAVVRPRRRAQACPALARRLVLHCPLLHDCGASLDAIQPPRHARFSTLSRFCL